MHGIIWGCCTPSEDLTDAPAILGRVRHLRGEDRLTPGRRLERVGDVPAKGDDVPLGRWFPARPTNAARLSKSERIRQLETLGYVAGSHAPTGNPVVPRHDETRSQPGYNFYVSGHARVALLTDMQGRVLHRWHHRMRPRAERTQFDSPNFFRAHLYENGDVLALLPGESLVKLDRNSKVIWEMEMRVHHDLDVQPGGDIYVLTRHARKVPGLDPDRLVVEDFIEVLQANGQQKRRVSVLQAFERSAFAELLHRSEVKRGDVLHTNTVSVLDGRFADRAPWLSRGNVLISSRVLDVVAVVDMEEETVVHAWAGSFRKQHDPHLLETGQILLFDNRGAGDASSAMEFDPTTDEVVWEYRGTDTDPFFSET